MHQPAVGVSMQEQQLGVQKSQASRAIPLSWRDGVVKATPQQLNLNYRWHSQETSICEFDAAKTLHKHHASPQADLEACVATAATSRYSFVCICGKSGTWPYLCQVDTDTLLLSVTRNSGYFISLSSHFYYFLLLTSAISWLFATHMQIYNKCEHYI